MGDVEERAVVWRVEDPDGVVSSEPGARDAGHDPPGSGHGDAVASALGAMAVSRCPGGVALLDRLERHQRPDLLLLDARLPDAGAQLTALRRHASALELPVLLVGAPDRAACARWLDAGANDALPADAGAAELAARAAALVRLRRAWQRRRADTPSHGDVWHRALTQNFPNGGVFLFDREMRFLVADGEGLRAAGLRSRDVVGRTLDEVLPPAQSSQLEPHYRAALAGQAHTFEVEAMSKIHRTLTAPVYDERGEVIAGLAMSQDVTHERETEQALRRSEEELRDTIEKLPDALALRRGDRLLWVNAAWARLLACPSREHCIGKSLYDVVHADDRERLRARLGASDDTFEQLRFCREDGQIALLEVAEIRAIRFGGEPAVLLVARDVTERSRMEGRLRLADRMASVGTLAAGVAHEINNPLSYVLANVRLVRERLDEIVAGLHETGAREPLAAELVCALECAEVRDALADACAGAERVGQIVRDLKTFSRADEERREVLDVRRVLDAAINLAWNEIRHRAQLVRAFGAAPAVDANDARLGQVFLNLLVNAAQAIPEGQVHEHRVQVTTGTAADGSALVEVSDTGSGIAREHLARVFDPFFTTKRPGVGTGLGLSICHGIVTGYGGRIEVDSTPGRGSTFRVLLPPATSARAAATPAPAPPSVAGARGRVLIVDDEVGVAKAMRRTLGRQHEVQTAFSGAEALALIDQGSFDVIFCDLMMPTMSGMDLYEGLVARGSPATERFVFMTGGAFTPRAREFLERVPNARIDKPFDPERLRALVNGMLRLSPP